ncbi:MAG: helix-turn-helix domain-containing protein [Prevotella sp.]|nr:helix-turn-helix domain-containing protein [Prevotella sp.]
MTLHVVARHYDLTSHRISTADGLPSNTVIRIWQDEKGYMWFETRNGTCRFDGYEIVAVNAVPPPDSVWNSLQTREAVWQREGQGRLARHGNDGSVRSWQLIPPDIIGYTRNDHFHVADVDEQTEVISTYGNGLFLYDKPTGELTHIQKDDRHGVLNDNYLTGVFVDHTGCIWVIEDYIGINCLRQSNLRYTPLWLVPDAKIQDANNIRCIAPFGNHRLLVANQMGDTYYYNSQTDQFTFQQNDRYRVYMAHVDKKGREWIGTRGNGLWCNGIQVEGLPSKQIFNIREDAEGRIIVSILNGGVAILTNNQSHLLMTGKNVHDALADSDSQLWVATEDGLFLLNKQGVVTDSLPGCFACLLAGDGKTIWGGTTDRGLLQLHSDRGKLVSKSYTKGHGLVSDGIYSLTTDRLGRLWMGTEEGMSMLDVQRDIIANYKISESSLTNVFCERAAACLEDGRLLFGTHNGIVIVMPTTETVPVTTQTSITGLMANGILSADSTLSYRQNNLTFSFSNFLYAHLENVVFKYRLDGFDKDWSQSAADHSVTYRGLPPGRYTFRVSSSNGGDVWSEEATMMVTISQPWWNTWWAWMLYVLMAGVVLVTAVVIMRKIMQLHRKLDIERRVSAFKMDFYNRLERELRNPVNVVQGAAENVQMSGTSKTTVQSLRRSSRRMLKLMDMIQQFHRLDDLELQVKAEQDAMNEEAEKRFIDIRDAIHAEEQEFRELAPPPINEQTVLIIEEDRDNLTHLTDTLNPYFRIISCQTLVEGMECIEEQLPSIVLIDLTADEKSALDLTRRIHKERPALAVIHLSSFNSDAHQLRSLRSGAVDYITKPFSGKVLVERMTGILKLMDHRDKDVNPAVSQEPVATTQHILTNPKDKKFLDQFHAILAQHIADVNFSVEQFAELMSLGRTQFYKRVKVLSGKTPVQHLHRARLEYAAKLLLDTQLTVEEVMIRSGFNSPTHFYKSFKEMFGQSPKEYRNTI